MTDINIGKLGFGFMRLPKKGVIIDIEQTKKMVDLFIESGFTYFDTAFVYPGSEQALRKSLIERYPRDRYQIATKLFASVVPTEKIAKNEFKTSLGRLGTDYIDYYLLHALDNKNYKKYEKMHLWDYVKDLKDSGLIRHYGFSYHGDSKLLDQLLTEHPDAEFVQLQINYKDWDDPKIESKNNYDVARKHSKPVIVMEPVKGGKLADPPESVKKLLSDFDKDASYASWAIRYAASFDGVMTVLSGMSDLEQMKDNISFMKDFRPLNEKESMLIEQARRLLDNEFGIPCTSCRYCVPNCPKEIEIPAILAALNQHLEHADIQEAKSKYNQVIKGHAKASECIKCRKCEKSCPQHIDITENLERAAKLFE